MLSLTKNRLNGLPSLTNKEASILYDFKEKYDAEFFELSIKSSGEEGEHAVLSIELFDADETTIAEFHVYKLANFDGLYLGKMYKMSQLGIVD